MVNGGAGNGAGAGAGPSGCLVSGLRSVVPWALTALLAFAGSGSGWPSGLGDHWGLGIWAQFCPGQASRLRLLNFTLAGSSPGRLLITKWQVP
jgi:hypothetical protein